MCYIFCRLMPLFLAIQLSLLLDCVGTLLGLTFFCGRHFSLHLTPEIEKTAKLLCSLPKQISPSPTPKSSSSIQENNFKEENICEKDHIKLPIDLALLSNLENWNLTMTPYHYLGIFALCVLILFFISAFCIRIIYPYVSCLIWVRQNFSNPPQ